MNKSYINNFVYCVETKNFKQNFYNQAKLKVSFLR